MRCPSKLFLIGEYLPLAGEPAIVAALPPHYEMKPDSGAKWKAPTGSPAAAWGTLPQTWRDPWDGAGGFGGSTAEFLLAARAQGITDPWEVWERYRAVTATELTPPSGVDLLAQALGGVHVIEWMARKAIDLLTPLQSLDVFVFCANGSLGSRSRKVATHQHLAERPKWESARDPLRSCVDSARVAIGDRDASGFGRCLTTYAETLHGLGLEHPDAKSDRDALLKLPGVLGAKGCGALLADALVVVAEPRVDAISLIAQAKQRGLGFVGHNPWVVA